LPIWNWAPKIWTAFHQRSTFSDSWPLVYIKKPRW